MSGAESGFSLALNPQNVDSAVAAEFRLQMREVVGVPLAPSEITGAYLHGTGRHRRPVTLQAPLFSDHVFEGQCETGEGEAFIVFATNTVAEDEVLLALIEMRPQNEMVAVAK